MISRTSRPTTPTARRRRLVLALGSVAVLVTLVGLGLHGLGADPEPARSAPPEPVATRAQSPSAVPSDDVSSWQELPALPETNHAIPYARAVATALFTWDTMSGLTPRDYGNIVLADADPSGTESSGLTSDLDNYLPADDVWRQLRQYETTQTLDIYRVYQPVAWAKIVDESREQIPEGTTAVTIRATRQREGVWQGERETVNEDVAFTVFVGCRPMFDRCHILRLSELDNPL